MSSVVAVAQRTDTFQVYFAFGAPRLSKQATNYIDNLIFNALLLHGQKLTILGYADYVGGHGFNDTLSTRRARNVLKYLVSSGFDEKDIKLCIGKGKIDRSPVSGMQGYDRDRKVQIIIDKVRKMDSAALARKKGTRTTMPPTSSLKVNTAYPLNILFEDASSIFLEKSNTVLRQLLDFMVKNPTVKIRIEGHICCLEPTSKLDGHDKTTGGRLSWTRAKAVYDFLLKNNISRDRLSYIGLGASAPDVYPELTEEDKEKNRRVEMRIMSK